VRDQPVQVEDVGQRVDEAVDEVEGLTEVKALATMWVYDREEQHHEGVSVFALLMRPCARAEELRTENVELRTAEPSTRTLNPER